MLRELNGGPGRHLSAVGAVVWAVLVVEDGVQRTTRLYHDWKCFRPPLLIVGPGVRSSGMSQAEMPGLLGIGAIH